MVPLKPNELRRDVQRARLSTPRRGAARAAASAGTRNDDHLDDTIDDRWAFNLRARRSAFHVRRTARVVPSSRPAQLRVDRDGARQERPDHQRSETRGRGARLEVAHV